MFMFPRSFWSYAHHYAGLHHSLGLASDEFVWHSPVGFGPGGFVDFFSFQRGSDTLALTSPILDNKKTKDLKSRHREIKELCKEWGMQSPAYRHCRPLPGKRVFTPANPKRTLNSSSASPWAEMTLLAACDWRKQKLLCGRLVTCSLFGFRS